MKSVLITGCSSGFGLVTALLFARRGDRVFATMREPRRGRELTDAAAREKLDLRVLPLDVTDPASVTTAVRACEEIGPIDVVVNNAGIELRSSIEDASDEDVHRQFDTNVFGLLRVVRAVLPGMRARGTGVVANVSSIAGLVARPFGGLYAASKHAVEAVSEALHYEVSPFGIRVVLVEPGQYTTRLVDNALLGSGFDRNSPYRERSERFDEAIRRLVPGGERPRPDEVAEIIHRAVYAEPHKLRHLAGSDAELIASAYRQLDFEEYERAMRAQLDWWD